MKRNAKAGDQSSSKEMAQNNKNNDKMVGEEKESEDATDVGAGIDIGRVLSEAKPTKASLPPLGKDSAPLHETQECE